MNQTDQSAPASPKYPPNIKLTSSFNPLASYAELPKGVKFQDQDSDEIVEILLRRHPITNTKWLIPVAIAAIFPPFFTTLPLEMLGLDGLYQIPMHVRVLITMFWYVVVAGVAIERFIIWYFNVYLVTNKRIIDVDFHGIMRYTSSEVAIHQIQDVRHSQGGVWQMLFRYGSVHIQSSGSDQNTEFEKIPMPTRVADIITDLLPIPTDVKWGTASNSQNKQSQGGPHGQ